MDRTLYDELLKWKMRKDRKPLILRGVRQCGKTYLVNKFAAENYDDHVYLEFDKDPALSRIFDGDLEPERVISSISLRLMKDISERTLLIFDEIQSCPRALTSLKYFCDLAPQYHIICAGSLLGLQMPKRRSDETFSQASGKASFPVGKVSFLDLYPMNFREFLMANGNERLSCHIDQLKRGEKIDESVTDVLEREYLTYCCVGGMPEAVQKWTETKNMTEVERIQNEIMDTYRLDFLKHVPEEDIKKVNMIWDHLPIQLCRENKRFFFGHAVPGSRSKDLEDAIQWLSDAGMIHKVRLISKPSIPLSSYASANIFKLYMSDIGLFRTAAGVGADSILNGNTAKDDFEGGITENFVLCELISSGHEDLYYWGSENTAEIDFVLNIKDEIVPIEIKAGKHVRAASLAQYVDRYNPSCAAVISKKNFKEGSPVTHIPLYAVWKLDKWLGL